MSPNQILALALVAAAACGNKQKPPEEPIAAAPDQPLEVEAPPPAEEDAPAPTVEFRGGQIALSTAVVFETGSATLAAESDGILGAVAEFLTGREDLTLLRIEGHSDAQGAEQANQSMSEQRALAVARWLVEHGVACQRLIPVGFGETKPIADNSTAEGKAQNRRMEFIAAALRGRAIGGMPADGGGQVAGDPCR